MQEDAAQDSHLAVNVRDEVLDVPGGGDELPLVGQHRVHLGVRVERAGDGEGNHGEDCGDAAGPRPSGWCPPVRPPPLLARPQPPSLPPCSGVRGKKMRGEEVGDEEVKGEW